MPWSWPVHVGRPLLMLGDPGDPESGNSIVSYLTVVFLGGCSIF